MQLFLRKVAMIDSKSAYFWYKRKFPYSRTGVATGIYSIFFKGIAKFLQVF
jgi:hypothetical protein